MPRVRSAGLPIALGAVVLALLAVLATIGWVVTQGGASPSQLADEADEPDAVVALVGDPGRLAPARALAERTGATLVVSQRTRDSRYYDVGDRPELCAGADGEEVVCFLADPHATRGEARAIGELVAHRGWDDLVVVTSRYHLRRAGLLVRQCVPDADVELMAADGILALDKVLREVLALGPALTIHRAC